MPSGRIRDLYIPRSPPRACRHATMSRAECCEDDRDLSRLILGAKSSVQPKLRGIVAKTYVYVNLSAGVGAVHWLVFLSLRRMSTVPIDACGVTTLISVSDTTV